MGTSQTKFDQHKTALLIIDVQMAFVLRDERGDARSMPSAESNIQRLMDAFRETDAAVIHIHHHSTEPDSLFRPELPGSEVQPFVKPLGDERVYTKQVNSGFIGTSLEADLRQAGIDTLVMCGATANHCVETTTRMAGNLNFETYYVADAVWAYGSTGPDHKYHSPEDVHSSAMNSLHGEFATVLASDAVLAML